MITATMAVALNTTITVTGTVTVTVSIPVSTKEIAAGTNTSKAFATDTVSMTNCY